MKAPLSIFLLETQKAVLPHLFTIQSHPGLYGIIFLLTMLLFKHLLQGSSKTEHLKGNEGIHQRMQIQLKPLELQRSWPSSFTWFSLLIFWSYVFLEMAYVVADFKLHLNLLVYASSEASVHVKWLKLESIADDIAFLASVFV